MAQSVTVYSTATCPYCKMVKDFLRQNNIAFVEVDVAQDQRAAQEMVNKSGQMGVPQLEIDGQIIVGFDRVAIKKALNLP
ncbi:MAG: glutathione S-transferase N-terminal domain-containing protein [Candidatus Omnitrophica bacterium]|nr:glutathione S-transferase N-terminal domain-containing protein [Candidatus Omnitrophota bacterium]